MISFCLILTAIRVRLEAVLPYGSALVRRAVRAGRGASSSFLHRADSGAALAGLVRSAKGTSMRYGTLRSWVRLFELNRGAQAWSCGCFLGCLAPRLTT